MLKKLIPDPFILLLIATILFASLLPVQGQGAIIAGHVMTAAIFSLFFLHGLRLPRDELGAALRNWRLQLLILAIVFGLLPILGLLLCWPAQYLIPAGLVSGILFLGILPSTVQSAISYSAIAGGNVAANVMASALTNLLAIAYTPIMAALLLASGSGAGPGSDVVLKIISILLLPFALGQFAQKWVSGWALRYKPQLAKADKAAIAIAVYVAFSAAVAGGLWQMVDLLIMIKLAGLLLAMLLLAFIGSQLLARLFHLPLADRISLIFAGTHKSIATGAPLAALMFPGPKAGMIILPALIYHLFQLMLSAPLANHYAARLAKQKSDGK